MFLQEATPVISPWLRPEFLVVAVPIVVGVIAWFVRGEFQTRANAVRQRDYEEAMDERVTKAEETQERVKTAMYAHIADNNRHHNAEAFNEFRSGLSQRLSTIDTSLAEIKRMVAANGTK